ncbi:MAG: hypothetical protein KC912_25800 [Proteobacteria bacterium]|nr:hypothetical protein [Pseudomonadota bacterium]
MGVSPRRIQDAHELVELWHRAAVGRELHEAEGFEDQIAEAHAQRIEIDERIASLSAARDSAHARADALGAEVDGRTYEAMFDVLLEQARAVELRAVALREAEDGEDSDWLRQLGSGPLAPKLAEYVEFRQKVEPGLSAFPVTYRSVVRQHHEAVKQELTDWFEAQDLKPVKVDAKPLTLDVVLAVDVPEDELAVIMAVLPVASDVQARWAERHDGLGMLIAARAVEGLYKCAHAMGHREAQVLFGGHRGLIAVEIELEGDPVDLGPAFAGAVQAALDRAPELEAAKIRAQVGVLPVEQVLPPEALEGGADAG